MNNKIKRIIVATVTLTLICAISTAALGFTNQLTEPKIEELNAQKENEAMERIIAAATYEKGTIEFEEQNYDYYRAIDENGQEKGIIFNVFGNGYGGKVKVMVGINPDKTVAAIEVVDVPNETPGLGQKAKAKEFWEQFEGKKKGVTATKSGSDENSVHALTGATVTSNAVTYSVNKAFALYDEVIMKGVGDNG